MLVRELTIAANLHPRGQHHLSSTSGLIRTGHYLYLVADDEHHLGVMDVRELASGDLRLHRIVPGELPHDKGDRKKRKPDMESIALLPAAQSPCWPHGALLVLGSGSRPDRQRAVVTPLDVEGAIDGEATVIDLHALYAPLRGEFADLNIEGAFVLGDRLRLLQRANTGRDSRNACIDFSLQEIVDWLTQAGTSTPPAARVHPITLPTFNGVPLGLTDGAALDNGEWIFSAVAEDTADSFNDGACAACALGWVSADGELRRLEWIDGAPKVEGIALAPDGLLWMVTDADDPERASVLLSAAV
ncbi:hypothetical protein [Caenimonas sp. SL110]|uniref:DUF6910 family protein n=1 Tax=Caenimonas sp. SL110 TaxID=1450524 RepID=UPI0006549AFE|nr:hypothetical protein [Caenimonas sp. SL110]